MENFELLDITVGGMLEKMATEHPDSLYLKYTDRDYCRTYKEFNEEVDRVAKGMLAMGIKKGDHIAIWATNIPEWQISLYAAAKIGCVYVTVNTAYKVFELEYLLAQSDTKALILMDGFKDADYIQIVNELLPELKNSDKANFSTEKLPFLKYLIYCGEKEIPGMYNYKELYDLADNVSDEEYLKIKNSIKPDDVTNMQYTSGTTGFPKGVMLTHKNIVNNGKCIGDGMKFTENDKLCVCVPFFHCFGLVLATMASLTHATGMVPIDYYRPLKVLQALESEKCTAVHGVPTMFIAMLEHPEFEKFDLSNMRTGIMAGSPCPIKVMRDVVDKMHMKDIVIVYGQTEASPGCTMTTTFDSLEHRVTTVGRHFPGVETKIVDPETGKELPKNTPGEFCARGYNIMRGYYKMEEATRHVIDADGWLHTGDIATEDEEGYYKITGRLKDMIIRGGENIYPKEIEEFLYTHEKIKDVQVIGVPSKNYGEEICACIVVKENETLTEDEVKAYVKANMAKHKTPSYIWFVDGFPMNAAGKIQKFKLRALAVEKFNLGEADKIETA